MKSTNKTQERAERSGINFKAKFAGEALVTPICFNPNADVLRKEKQIKEEFDVNEPTYKKTVRVYEDNQPVEKDFSIVSLLCKYNPNEILKVKGQYPNDMFVNFEIYVSPEQVKGRDKNDSDGNVIPNSAKFQVIDDHNNSGWVAMKPKQTLSKAIQEVIDGNEYSEFDPIRKVDPATARIACVGEVALYDLLFNMSSCDKHNPEKDQHLSEFTISDKPTEAFTRLCNGDVNDLNKFMSDFKEFFQTNNKNNLLGVFLAVNTNKDKTSLFQTCYRSATERNQYISCTFRPTSRLVEINDKNLGGKFKTRLPKELIKHLTDAKYPWNGEWGTNLAFKEITLDSIVDNETMIHAGEDEDDDLPF
jgi:hypothetical protein